jgi:hypothetical protein
MNYRVIGERIMNAHDDNQVDRHESEFTSYTDAVDYYISTVSQVVEDMTDLGGDFVCTLVCDKDDETIEVMKRHVISTTILL